MQIIERPERELVHFGSVKIIYRVDDKTLAFKHTNNFSLFDVGPHPQQIPGMGRAVLRCSMASDRIAKTIGVRTCVIGQEDKDTILVREFQTPKGRPLRPDETDVMIPLEWIDRDYVSGSLARAFKAGEKRPTDYGFGSNNSDKLPLDGTELPFPHHEATTKWEDVDRQMDLEETLAYAGVTRLEWDRAWRVIAKLNGALALAAAAAGFKRLDGKKEMAFSGPAKELVVIDAFGNPNEDRYAPIETLRPGNVDHYSKEWLRQLFIKKGYKKVLDAAREQNLPDPEYPPLTDEEIAEARRRYEIFAGLYEAAVNRILGANERRLEFFDAGFARKP